MYTDALRQNVKNSVKPIHMGSSAADPDDEQDAEYFIRQAFKTDPKKGCELLFRAYYRDLCSTVIRFVYSRQATEDIVGEVFLLFWNNQIYQTITTSYRAYLFRAVRNRALNYLKFELHRSASLDLVSDENESDAVQQPDHILQLDELLRRINEIVRTLPLQAQRVFIMSRFDGRSHAEIAQELQINHKTVESHITRALSSLRHLLRQELCLLLLGLSYSLGS
ncbi:RNA polymerase sigma-70 factor [Spirosoma sp. KCTC 42546]|uniref:RNA polymerase sigma-70 factor n=1 Tax=Spirosoma sp. KCTC 42546 TaxID=2520506 RepID=UPI0011571D86|nr:RNA polymerase sigma-70 factor [Spirosoma sp. KCTC 42546]QDK79935.1 RNA polymerase sigma-70 factor [Spirosoma sp. KCTC 42546]